MPGTVDVYVLTGQSNSLGTSDDPARLGELPPADANDGSIHFWWSNMESAAVAYGDSCSKITSLQVQQGNSVNPCFWGPEFGFARRMRERSPAQPILLVKVSRGGGGNKFWLKDTGHMYRDIVTQVQAAVMTLAPDQGYRVRALLYVQGESDSDDESSRSGVRLEALIQNLREDLPCGKDLVGVVGGIACVTETRKPRCDKVRHQQRALAAARPDLCCYVDNLDLAGTLYDGLHFDATAKILVGVRMADSWLELQRLQPPRPNHIDDCTLGHKL